MYISKVVEKESDLLSNRQELSKLYTITNYTYYRKEHGPSMTFCLKRVLMKYTLIPMISKI